MRRREFISLVSGAVTASVAPLAAHAQFSDRTRRVGVVTFFADGDQEGHSRVAAFRSGLRELGWKEGENVFVDYRWAAGDRDRLRAYAAELVRLKPDVILSNSTPVLAALRAETRSIPVVFTGVSDPVGTGVVGSLARPGGHITGFANFEPSIGGKWLQALKELAPDVREVAFLFNPQNASWAPIFEEIKAVSALLHVESIASAVHGAAEIKQALGDSSNRGIGLIVQPDGITLAHRRVIIDLAQKHRLPAVYPFRVFALDGGLMAYGIDVVDQFRRAASYVDRILKGANPGDLPIQAPTKFDLVINLKTAHALGLDIPPILLARADEVIE
jgi:putative tryptophan/tyrosine transport system substrate-binding protein